jgi:allantoin racemase
LDLDADDAQSSYNSIRDAARKALEEDRAEVICLGCAGMSGLDKELERELNVPVIDGVVSALKLMEGLLRYGSRTSKRRAYAYPRHKDLDNLPTEFNQGYNDYPLA